MAIPHSPANKWTTEKNDDYRRIAKTSRALKMCNYFSASAATKIGKTYFSKKVKDS